MCVVLCVNAYNKKPTDTRTRARESEADTGPMQTEYYSVTRALRRGRGRITDYVTMGGVTQRERENEAHASAPDW